MEPPNGNHRQELRVLWIDDEPLMLRTVELASAESGVQIETAGGTEEARARIEQASYDWIVCDYRLRRGTAEAFVRELLARGQRVIVLTGDVTTVDPTLGVRVIEKPVALSDLLATLRQGKFGTLP